MTYDWNTSYKPEYTYGGPGYITDSTMWKTTTTTYEPFTTEDAITISTPPTEYTLEYDGSIKYKEVEDDAEDAWESIEALPDPFVLEPKRKKTVKARIKIKFDKKLRVDVEELADMLF
jgi:hypothetical protein